MKVIISSQTTAEADSSIPTSRISFDTLTLEDLVALVNNSGDSESFKDILKMTEDGDYEYSMTVTKTNQGHPKVNLYLHLMSTRAQNWYGADGEYQYEPYIITYNQQEWRFEAVSSGSRLMTEEEIKEHFDNGGGL